MAAACTTTGPGGTMAMAMSLPRLRLRLCTPSSSVASTCILTTPTFKRIKCIQILMCSVSEFVLGWVLTGLMSRKQGVVFQQAVVTEDRDGDGDGCRRREAMLKMALYLATTAVSLPALADGVDLDEAPAELRVYSDDVNKFKISIPQDWQVGAGESDGIKSITAFFPQGASTSNVSVAITGIGPDFTRLESFGKVDAFAESLVNGLDRSWQRPPGIAAKLIDCKAANGLYYLEYTLQKPGENRRHIYSAIGMANNGWYNRLYTVTGQFVEEESDKFGSTIEKAVQSFTLG